MLSCGLLVECVWIRFLFTDKIGKFCASTLPMIRSALVQDDNREEIVLCLRVFRNACAECVENQNAFRFVLLCVSLVLCCT